MFSSSAHFHHFACFLVSCFSKMKTILNLFTPPLLLLWIVGCAQPEYNKTPTSSEADSLSDIIQLTHDFDRAGEAYFSRDMKWIIFQAYPHGGDQYQMYVAQVMYDVIEKSPPPETVLRATP